MAQKKHTGWERKKKRRTQDKIAKRADPKVSVTVEFESDSNTFIVRLVKEPRVLVFRLSDSQVHGDGREAECEKTLNRKIKDLWNLI